jgi:phosphatidylserine synthase
MSRNRTLRSVGVVGAAALVALGIWAVVRLLGVDLTVRMGEGTSQVGAPEVLAATVLAGLAAWAVHRLLDRSERTTRWWPFVGSTLIAISMLGPSYLADGAASVALIAMHLAVGAVLIWGFARYVGRPYYQPT